MNPTAQQVADILARKQEIERATPGYIELQWLIDAVELLLRIELERQEFK